MKKTVCLILALTMLCASAAPVFAAGEPAPEETVITVDYDRIAEHIAENNPAVLSVLQAYHKLRLQLNALESSHSDLLKSPLSLMEIASPAMTLQNAMKELSDALKNMDKDLNKAADGQIHVARMMYLRQFILTEQLQTAERALAAAKRDMELYLKKLEIGLISQSTPESFEKIVTAHTDAVKALRKASDDNLTALSDLLGINTPIQLGALPEIELGGIKERDLKADLAAYTLSASDVQAKKAAYNNASDALASASNAANIYARDVAKKNYETAKVLAARDFPRVYGDLSDIYEDHISSSAVKDAEKDLDKLQKQFDAGFVSLNTVIAAERALADAKSKYEQERLSVFTALLQYEYDLIDRE